MVLAKESHAKGIYRIHCLGVPDPERPDTWSYLDKTDTPLFAVAVQLAPTLSILDGWTRFLRHAHPDSPIFDNLQSAIRALILAEHPTACQDWRLHSIHSDNSMIFVGSVAGNTGSCVVRLERPAWFQAMNVLRWTRHPLTPEGAMCPMIEAPIPMGTSRHRKMEILAASRARAREMPAFDDPAFPIFWGLTPPA